MTHHNTLAFLFSARLIFISLVFINHTALAQTATQITAANADTLIQRGPDAIGGIGDWVLSNGTLCAVISNVNQESEFSTRGGSLVDLGFCGRADDHYSYKHNIIDGERSKVTQAQSLRVESGGDAQHRWAGISVVEENDNIQITTRYRLNQQHPTQLSITSTVALVDTTQAGLNFLNLFNFNYRSLEAFVFNSTQPKLSSGFAHEDFISRGITALRHAAHNADTIISLSPRDAEHAIAYGWHLKSAQRIDGEQTSDLPRFALVDNSSNAFLILPESFYVGNGRRIGWLQLAQIPLLSLKGEQRLQIEEVIYIGERADVASITDQLLPHNTTVSGTTFDLDSALHIKHPDGSPLNFVRPDSAGLMSVKLPAGEYQLEHLDVANRQRISHILIGADKFDLGALNLTGGGRVILPSKTAMRLVFKGVNGTPDPQFDDSLTRATITDNTGIHSNKTHSQVFLAGVDGDLSEVKLAAGEYRVLATRGPEFSIQSSTFSISDGETKKLHIQTPQRVLQTPNFIASDLHVHSGWSFDNTFSSSERVRTFVAEHGEIMVSSEHDRPTDFAPLIAQMQVDDKITSIPAVEITSTVISQANPYTGGHANAFPFLPRQHEHRQGMFKHEQNRLRDTIHAVKSRHPNALVQLNHPRTSSALSGKIPSDYSELISYGSYFEHMGQAAYPYQPEQPLDSSPNNNLIEKHPTTGLRDIDIDLLEVVNPSNHNHLDRLHAVRKDWLSLLKQGERITATANSDSHTAHEVVGIPRTMVAVSNDSVTGYSQEEFLHALKNGNAYGTSGPFFTIDLGGQAMGSTFVGSRSDLSLTVFAADWVNLDKVQVQINGDTVASYALRNGEPTVLRIPLIFKRDSFVTIEIHGAASPDYATLYPNLTPYAFSNPIYVDFDGDGKWTAPGL